ncbi:MAG TPA: arginine--tRNA ligase [Opitutaceae bacterium]|nr:arginine--tRNA ligase [Opitutaceae bacterium]
MPASFQTADRLSRLVAEAAAEAGMDSGFAPAVEPSAQAGTDYQANGVLGWAKKERKNPRQAAQGLLQALEPKLKGLASASIGGPGFINFALTPEALLEWLRAFPDAPSLEAGAAGALGGQTWIVDYSSPNTAKQMHVGHLRSAVIGEAICRLLAFSGARVIRDNHIGDWGTQFGKLIWAYKRQADPAALERDPIEEFERLYKAGSGASDADPAVLREAQQELVKLQSGDPENLAIWRRITEGSLRSFQQIYDRLGIRFDQTLGESFYNDKVERIYRELQGHGLAAESEGALVVFHPEHPRFKTQPFIIRKSDGAANYASTDLATVLYRAEHLHATGALYVVDTRQKDHFEQLFLTVRKWFAAAGRAAPQLELVDFGTVLGEDGKPLKTRSGDNIRLKDLLAEAEERAYALVSEKSPDLPEAERRAIAAVVGVGSVQYADLAQNRSSDYLFAWDKAISLEGNTAAYLLYAVARIRSIFRKLGADPRAPEAGAPAGAPESPGELALARKLVRFADAVRLAQSSLRPHFLCLYLYELAGDFSAFYGTDKVAVDEPAVRARRQLLCARALLVLETGLRLLGLRTLERM